MLNPYMLVQNCRKEEKKLLQTSKSNTSDKVRSNVCEKFRQQLKPIREENCRF